MKRNQLFLLTFLGFVAVASAYGLSVVGNDTETSGREKAVLLKDVPAAVKATILAEVLQEAFELEIEVHAGEGAGGTSVFDVEFEFGGTDVELEIAANGKVLEKEVARAHDDDEDDDDDDDDD